MTGSDYHDTVLLFGCVLIVAGMLLAAYAYNQYAKMQRLSSIVLSSLDLDKRQLESAQRVELSRAAVMTALTNIHFVLESVKNENAANLDINKDRIALLELLLNTKLKFLPDPNKNTITYANKCEHHDLYFMSIYKHGEQDKVNQTGIMFSVSKHGDENHVCVYCEDRMIFKFVTKLKFDEYLISPHFVSKL